MQSVWLSSDHQLVMPCLPVANLCLRFVHIQKASSTPAPQRSSFQRLQISPAIFISYKMRGVEPATEEVVRRDLKRNSHGVKFPALHRHSPWLPSCMRSYCRQPVLLLQLQIGPVLQGEERQWALKLLYLDPFSLRPGSVAFLSGHTIELHG